MNCLLIMSGFLVMFWLMPFSQQNQPSDVKGGYGGAQVRQIETPQTGQMVCASPADVFKQFGFSPEKVPAKNVLAQLPTPEQQPVQHAGDLSYDPQKDELCTIGWKGIYTRYIQTQATPQQQTGNPKPSENSFGLEWVQSILNGLFSSIQQGFSSALTGIIDWVTSFGFMFVTPKALTYDQPVVKSLHAWMVGLLGGLVSLVLVVGGYNYMLGHNKIFRELAPRLALSGVAAAFSLFFIAQFIELQNALCTGVLGVLASVGIGDLSLPLGNINIMTAPAYEITVYLVDLIISVLLCFQMVVRIALLDLLAVLAPLGLLCFALPQTVAWGRLWAQAFVSALILQFLQTICVGLGSALIASFAHSSYTPVSVLIGIAALYLAFKLPGMLLSNVLRASVGEVNRDVGSTVRTVAEVAAVVAA